MAEDATPNHRDAERRMREIVRNAELPEPDQVRYELDPDEVVLLWNEPKLAVVIDLDDDGTGEIEFRESSERHADSSADARGMMWQQMLLQGRNGGAPVR